MKKIDEQLLISQNTKGFYLSVKQLQQMMECSPRHLRGLIDGIRKETDRYGRYAVLDSGDLRVNIFALIDYDKYRKQPTDRNARKSVPEFSAVEISRICPVAEKIIVISQE